MFALLKAKNPYEQNAVRVYAAILTQLRQPDFYKDYGVPDTLDGRFDLMILHMFLVMDRLLAEGAKEARDFNQALFDVTFADMDQGLREAGIGDMGVPKRMRKMMKGFNGRVHAYSAAVASDDALETALMRNLYGTVETPDMAGLHRMKDYIRDCRAVLQAQNFADLCAGRVKFASF